MSLDGLYVFAFGRTSIQRVMRVLPGLQAERSSPQGWWMIFSSSHLLDIFGLLTSRATHALHDGFVSSASCLLVDIWGPSIRAMRHQWQLPWAESVNNAQSQSHTSCSPVNTQANPFPRPLICSYLTNSLISTKSSAITLGKSAYLYPPPRSQRWGGRAPKRKKWIQAISNLDATITSHLIWHLTYCVASICRAIWGYWSKPETILLLTPNSPSTPPPNTPKKKQKNPRHTTKGCSILLCPLSLLMTVSLRSPALLHERAKTGIWAVHCQKMKQQNWKLVPTTDREKAERKKGKNSQIANILLVWHSSVPWMQFKREASLLY